MNAPQAEEQEEGTAPGPVAAHALAYADLVAALLHAWQRTLARQVLGAVMALGGLTAVTLLLTVAAVAAAWPTSSRWVVLFGVAGLYLVFAGIGMWLVLRRPPVSSPADVLVAELRKDVHLLSAALRRSPP